MMTAKLSCGHQSEIDEIFRTLLERLDNILPNKVAMMYCPICNDNVKIVRVLASNLKLDEEIASKWVN